MRSRTLFWQVLEKDHG